jgi:hypothetical protein
VNSQSMILVTLVLCCVLFLLMKLFIDKKISSGQTLFWLAPIFVAQGLTLFPSLIDRLSLLWGNLVPISWITFGSIVFLVLYLIYLTIRLNGYSRVVDLARSVTHLEQRLRDAEARCRELSEELARSR